MDDFSPLPVAPSLDVLEPTQQDEILLVEDQKRAKAYFHPAWEGVVDLFTQKIEAYRVGCTNPQLTANEYKVEDLANKKVAMLLTEILMEVENAVRSTEGREPTKQGGK